MVMARFVRVGCVCRRELRGRPVILRNAWSEPKENKVDPGETFVPVPGRQYGNTLTPASPNLSPEMFEEFRLLLGNHQHCRIS
jgi:hypothetical protein